MNVIFKKHYIQNKNSGKKCRVFYSLDNRCDGRKCVTMYAKSCLESMNGIITFENNSDMMTDYCESDRAVIFEDNSLYNSARSVAESVINERKLKHYNRIVSIYGEEKARRYAGI